MGVRGGGTRGFGEGGVRDRAGGSRGCAVGRREVRPGLREASWGYPGGGGGHDEESGVRSRGCEGRMRTRRGTDRDAMGDTDRDSVRRPGAPRGSAGANGAEMHRGAPGDAATALRGNHGGAAAR